MSRDFMPEPTQFNGEPPAMESVDDHEDTRERDWFGLECEARQFVDTYGAAAMLRCVSRALEPNK